MKATGIENFTGNSPLAARRVGVALDAVRSVVQACAFVEARRES
jgi:hypothetical protein